MVELLSVYKCYSYCTYCYTF